tara:strand:+ start:472 stop:606 length:135 start_codon:yes stop_codon:yes gene_type:complete
MSLLSEHAENRMKIINMKVLALRLDIKIYFNEYFLRLKSKSGDL